MGTKAVRFNDEEEKAIKDFLQKNPYFDFSTIARMAIINFIQNPEISLVATQVKTKANNQKSKVQ